MKKHRLRLPAWWARHRGMLHRGITFSVRDFAVSALLFLLSVTLCLLLRRLDPENDTSYVAMIFLLDVFLTAVLTDGYLFSFCSAILGVLAVDYVFTEPFWRVSFLITGFPITFLVMLVISITTGVVASRAKRMEAASREAERQKTYANLLRSVGHDIRTPLTGIAGAANVLIEQEDELEKPQRRELLQNINEEAQWLIRVVENMLSITRLGAEKTALRKTPEPAEELIESTVAKFTGRHSAIAAKVEVPQEFLMVPMDPILMQQVLTNLLENVADHARGATEVTVSLRRKDDNWAQITVADNGCGIPEEKLRTLFTAFSDVTPHGDNRRNMGIGLSVCHTVVAAHGGRIYAENQKSGGAAFTVELPLKEETNGNQR